VSQEQTHVIKSAGGLDTTASTIEMFDTPGAATRLINMEVSRNGGYKRISGYSKFGSTTPTGATAPILGLHKYADGGLAAQSTGIYFSDDGVTWIQINKDNAETGLDLTALNAEAALPRTSQGRNSISHYDGNEEYGILSFCDGVNKVAQLKITDTGGRKYHYWELEAASGAPQAPQYATSYKERLILAGDASSKSTVYWSNRFDVTDFTGASAGAVDVGDIITGLKSHRDILYVFCRDSIHRISNLDGAPKRELVTRKVGCISGWSIQEVAGDLLFLAPDGLRTIAGTDRIADIEMSSVSSKINNLISGIVSGLSTFDINSLVVRESNQYRLYYSSDAQDSTIQRGIIGTLINRNGNTTWEWSETTGIEVSSITSEVQSSGTEISYHGDYDGFVYTHNSGASFDGASVKATYKTPDMSLGSTGDRKTLYSVKLSMEASATAEGLGMTLRYDFSNPNQHHPDTYYFETVYPAAEWGVMVWGASYWGSTGTPLLKMNVEGSGSSASLQFITDDTTSQYTINGLYIDTSHSGRLD